MSTEEILKERRNTHGDFGEMSLLTQAMKYQIRKGSSHEDFSPAMLEAADMILHKLARAAAGDPWEPDHWADIAGYATLVVKQITQEQERWNQTVSCEEDIIRTTAFPPEVNKQ